MDPLEVLIHPVTAIVLSLVLGAIALSGKFSQHAANILLTIAAVVGAYAVMRSGAKDPRLIIAGICVIGFVVCMISLWLKPPEPKMEPQQSVNAALTPPSQPIDSEALARKLAETLKSSTPPLNPKAHLHVTKFEWKLPQDQGGHAEVKVIFENNGNAPINKLIFCGRAAFYIYPQSQTGGLRTDDQKAFEEGLFSDIPTLTPDLIEKSDNEMPAGVDRSFTIKSSPWEQSAIDAFREGRAVVYVAGILTYSDKQSTLETKFCGYTAADGNMKFCHKNNAEP
jgi:hypothetical protein